MIHSVSADVWHLIGLRLFLALLMAAIGSLIAVNIKKINHQALCTLISFAAGALLAVVLLDIWPETVELVGAWKAILGFLTGYLLFAGITRFVFHICPACSASHSEAKFTAVTISMLIALSIHSFMDGLAIYSGHLGGREAGALILFAVAYHKLPEGMALALAARGSGMSASKAVFLSIGLEFVTTLLGGVAGLLFLLPSEAAWVGFVLGHIGGGFVFLVLHALLSEVMKHHPRNTIFSALIGALTIAIAGFFIGQH